METKEINIYEQTLTVRAPYAEGHVLNAIEAKTLNQTRAENVSNNFRKKIKAAVDGVPLKEGGEVQTLEQVIAEFNAYDEAYTFSMPSPGREPIDPIEREAQKIARQIIRENLQAQGKKLKDVDEAKYEAAVITVSEREEVVKEAKRRVNAQKKAAESSLEELGL